MHTLFAYAATVVAVFQALIMCVCHLDASACGGDACPSAATSSGVAFPQTPHHDHGHVRVCQAETPAPPSTEMVKQIVRDISVPPFIAVANGVANFIPAWMCRAIPATAPPPLFVTLKRTVHLRC